VADLNQAIGLSPSDARAYVTRGLAWCDQSRYDQAVSDFRDALTQSPHDVYVLGHFAWFRATCPDAKFRDGKNAVEIATRACELTGGTAAGHLCELAAAYAEAGDFDAAVKWQTTAMERLKDPSRQEWYADLLKSFREKKPYRATARKLAPTEPLSPEP
jgi:tetratricopeptide (TPR) repeat protein